MELTKQAISNHSKLIPGIEGYLILVSKIQSNKNKNPDIAIETCKSLIEGLCKKALELLSNDYNSHKQIRKDCDNKLPTLVRTAFTEVYRHSFQIEIHQSLYKLIYDKSRVYNLLKKIQEEPLKDIENAVIKISAIRDNRGDISHGRIYPKTDESDINLSLSICAITDGICSFMIGEMANQYNIKLEKDPDSKLIYDNQNEFNDWLDEIHHVSSIKVDFSKILFEKAYDKYEEYYYTEYIDLADTHEAPTFEEIATTEEEEMDNNTIMDVERVDQQETETPVEQLVAYFDEKTFWNEAKDQRLQEFVEAESLKLKELKEVINEYLFTNKPPLKDNIANSMNERPKLAEFKTLIPSLTTKIIAFADELNTPEV